MPQSNFDFLADLMPQVAAEAREAEALAIRSPRAACFQARAALEIAVQWLYRSDPGLRLPPDTRLSSLMRERSFRDNLPQKIFAKADSIRRGGNSAAHERRPPRASEAEHLVIELFHFLYWVGRMYGPDDLADQRFDKSLLPRGNAADKSAAEVARLQAALEERDALAALRTEREQQTSDELKALKAQVAALKAANAAKADPHDYHEADTRKYYIDTLLREAGWDPDATDVREYPVVGMPNTHKGWDGNGFVDYVLWDTNGAPLALVEAKRTRESVEKGAHQASLYADALEKQFGQRPVIFLTNGYEHRIWDDARYPRRRVDGFYTLAELQRLHHRRAHAKPIKSVDANLDIAGRPYQLEALKRIGETFDAQHRRALLVMATGTGKTRTAIALVDILLRAGWIKRVLFLADRTALLRQAKNAFTAHLPDTTAVNLTTHKGATNAPIVLATYPTMFNRIHERAADGTKRYGPGYFDLIIVDEAHRSVYQKYGALFEYFDALMVGLTATPRDEVHHHTYKIFGIDDDVPTFAYELEQAIEDDHLVPPKGVTVPFAYLREGIKYAALSDAAKAEYEEKLTDDETGEMPGEVAAPALNKWLFNIPTIDKAIKVLMELGIYVNGGDRLGKTIIFARNQKHAGKIAERFDKAYPEHKSKFAQVIHSKVDYADSLMDQFGDREKNPVVAISVDMMDTGVDVPECVNLVFFKPVYSRVKFNQMIGRGTRLCADLFGPGKDKTEFRIFDLCGNFEYFEQGLDKTAPPPANTLTARRVQARLAVVETMGEAPEPGPDWQPLRTSLLDDLHAHVQSMNRDHFAVRQHIRAVERFSKRDRWEQLDNTDLGTVNGTLAHLPDGLPPERHEAKQFDVLIYRLMVARLTNDKRFIGYRNRVMDLAHLLEEKKSVPMVNQVLALIQAVQSEELWEAITLKHLENIRKHLRDVMHFIDRKKMPEIDTDLPELLDDNAITDANVPIVQVGFSAAQYRKKVERIIRDNLDHISIAKLRRNQPVTAKDLEAIEGMLFDEETPRAQFETVYGAVDLPGFIRKLVGLERAAVQAAFSKYIVEQRFTANQIRFVQQIIDYLSHNGALEPKLLYAPPFTDLDPGGVSGLFDDADVLSLVRIVKAVSAGEAVG